MARSCSHIPGSTRSELWEDSKLALPVILAIGARHKGGHGFVCAPGLHLVVRSLSGSALATLEETLVIFILGIDRLSVESLNLEFVSPQSHTPMWIEFMWSHPDEVSHLDFPRLELFSKSARRILEVKLETQKLLLVPAAKHLVFP